MDAFEWYHWHPLRDLVWDQLACSACEKIKCMLSLEITSGHPFCLSEMCFTFWDIQNTFSPWLSIVVRMSPDTVQEMMTDVVSMIWSTRAQHRHPMMHLSEGRQAVATGLKRKAGSGYGVKKEGRQWLRG